MPTYQIKAPNGKTYRIEGPEGASDEQVRAAVMAQHPDADGGAGAIDAALKGGASREELLSLARQNNLNLNESDLDANLASRDAGGGTGGVLPPAEWTGKDTLEYLGDAGKTIATNAAKGVSGIVEFPLNVASTVSRGIRDSLRAGGGAALDAVGLEGAADWWRGDGREPERLPMPSEQLERLSPTPEGMEPLAFGSQLLGGMVVPFGPKPSIKPASVAQQSQPAKTAAQEVVEAGEQHGVRVMTSDVRPPRSFATKMVQSVGEKIPIAGTGGPRVAQQQERIDAVKRLAEDFGVEVGENYVEDIAADLAKTRGARLGSLTATKDGIIDGVQGAVQTPRAIQAIDQEIARLRGTMNDKVNPVIAELEQFKRAIGSGLSLRNVEENRRMLGKAFEGDSMASIKDIGTKAVQAIYDPLRRDMGEHIASVAGQGARDSWRKANDELAAMAGELGTANFRNALRDADTTPERVAQLLFSQKPSDVQRVVKNLSPEGQRKARAAVIQRALQKFDEGDGINFSPDKFSNELKRLGGPVGVAFEGLDRASVEGLGRVLQATKRAMQASAAPPTGVQNMPATGGFAAGALAGWAAVPWAAAGGLFARAYESRAFRNMLIGVAKTKPGSQAESRMMDRILQTVVSQGELQSQNIARAANDDFVPRSAVANEDNEQ